MRTAALLPHVVTTPRTTHVAFVPDAGDVVWLEFDPQDGHEQSGHRPAVVLSPASYDGRAGMIVCCPMTTRIEG